METSARRCEVSEIFHKESLWEFPLNSHYLFGRAASFRPVNLILEDGRGPVSKAVLRRS
jgi:hypothetical protein